MILFNKAFLKVWKVEKKEKYTALSCSTSDKQQDGNYKNSNWNVRLVGKANDVEVAEGDKIVVKSGKVENIWDKENNKNWLNVIVFELETDEGFKPIDVTEDILPF